jgi:sucrose-phosphate synthase
MSAAPDTIKSNKSENPIYVLMISMHGLIRGYDMELGRDADTGGQTTYVIELARALAKHSNVEKVDLLTRLIEDPNLSEDYAQPEEDLGDGARIVRLPCGPKRYLRKELLWPHLDQAVDKCLSFLRQQGRLPDLIHTHYADAGYVGQQLSLLLGIPQAHTGHSLGRPKLERMLASGRKPHVLEKQRIPYRHQHATRDRPPVRPVCKFQPFPLPRHPSGNQHLQILSPATQKDRVLHTKAGG